MSVVVVVGSVNQDVVTRVPRIPLPGETVLASGSSRGGGGKGANQAVAAARAAGARVSFVGAVGADADGDALRAALAAEGIDVTGLATVAAPTGTALVTVADDGENAIVVIPGANAAITDLSPAQRASIAAADVILTQLEVPVPLVLAAAAARKDGGVLILNAAPSAPMSDPVAGGQLLAMTDLLVVNEHELLEVAAALRPSPAEKTGSAGSSNAAVDASVDGSVDAAAEILAAHVPALVVTLGAAGALVVVGPERRRVAAFEAAPVDTTGAGDTFCGVLAAHVASACEAKRASAPGGALGGAPGGALDGALGSAPGGGLPGAGVDLEALAAAARAGAAAAALAVGRPGAQSAIPTVAEVGRLLRDAG